MKYLFCILFWPLAQAISAQPGIQSIYIEPYYVTSENDRKGETYSGPLEEGSVVYRVYADLEPGYRFQAAYGSPEHPLEISSDRPFFNHNHSGSSQSHLIPERDLAKNIALIDSWVSVGSATENHLGIPRKLDMIVPDNYLRFEPGFFTNVISKGNSDSGPLTLPLAQCDGLVRSEYMPVPTLYMADSLIWALTSVMRANRVYLENGAWACMGKGSVGADSTAGNHVLIAQLTTAGAINYKLNIMVGTPEGKSIRYVYANPTEGEVIHPALAGRYIWARHSQDSPSKKSKSGTP